jgi:hypothetical protein
MGYRQCTFRLEQDDFLSIFQETKKISVDKKYFKRPKKNISCKEESVIRDTKL